MYYNYKQLAVAAYRTLLRGAGTNSSNETTVCRLADEMILCFVL